MTASGTKIDDKTTLYHGTHIEKGPVADGTRIFVRGGDLTIEGPVGNGVVLQAEGDITLKADAGTSLYAYATGNVNVQTVGRDAKITAAGGKASAVELGENGYLTAKFGAAVTGEHVKCGDHSIFVQDGLASLYRKPNEAGVPSDPDSCFRVQRLPDTPKH